MTDAAAAFFAEYQRQLARADDLQAEDEKRRAQKRRRDLGDLNCKQTTPEPLLYRTISKSAPQQPPARLTPEQSKEWNAWAQETLDHWFETFLDPLVGKGLAETVLKAREHVQRELGKTRTEIETRLRLVEDRVAKLEGIVDEGRFRSAEDRVLRLEARLAAIMDAEATKIVRRVG
jgi:hypothetical protein